MIVVVATLIFLCDFLGWSQRALNRVQTVFIPLLAAEVALAKLVRSPIDYIFTSHRSAKELQSLKEKYVIQTAELNNLYQLQKENEAIREVVENKGKLEAGVKIASPVVSLSYPAIAVGSQQGIEKGRMVLYKDVLLGLVTEISDHQSRVALLSKKDGPVLLAKTSQGVEGIIKGSGKRVLFTEVPRGIELNKGDRVVSVGQEGVRRDVLIGVIEEVEDRPSAPTQTAILQQYVSFYDAPIVEVW